jgi:hypothetical protein
MLNIQDLMWSVDSYDLCPCCGRLWLCSSVTRVINEAGIFLFYFQCWLRKNRGDLCPGLCSRSSCHKGITTYVQDSILMASFRELV